MVAKSKPTVVEYRSNCPVTRSLDLVGDKWTLLIMRDVLFFDRKTFADFAASSEHIPTNLLSSRLKKLVACGLLTRNPYHDKPVRYEYLPTAAGEKLRPILDVIKQFGEENLSDEDP